MTSAFGDHVTHVVLVSAEREVIRAYTRGIVTAVHYVKANGNRTKRKLVREPVCLFLSASSVTRGPEADLPISAIAFETGPDPAGFSLLDLAPEANVRGSVPPWLCFVREIPSLGASARFNAVVGGVFTILSSQLISMCRAVYTVVGSLALTPSGVVSAHIRLAVFRVVPFTHKRLQSALR